MASAAAAAFVGAASERCSVAVALLAAIAAVVVARAAVPAAAAAVAVRWNETCNQRIHSSSTADNRQDGSDSTVFIAVQTFGRSVRIF